jgi:hypothetical protein
MRSSITGAVLLAVALAPASAEAKRPAYEHTYLAKYATLVSRHGVRAAGCNLVSNRWHNRCRGKTTKPRVVRSTAVLRRMLYVPRPAPSAAPPSMRAATPAVGAPSASAPASAAPAAVSSGGGCGDLPAYVVQRESGGDPNARNGRYGGCAQIDDAHFAPGGACAGLSYVACVNKLWDGGRGASNWPTAANPPG